jgi:hypothetical protein
MKQRPTAVGSHEDDGLEGLIDNGPLGPHSFAFWSISPAIAVCARPFQKGGVGHNPPQEAPKAFADALLKVAGMIRPRETAKP